MVREVVSALERRGLANDFRIGLSMHDIMISTVDHHGLPAGVPRVILVFQPEQDQVRIAYSDDLIWKEPLADEYASAAVATDRVLEYLRRLWNETKPSALLPDGLSHAVMQHLTHLVHQLQCGVWDNPIKSCASRFSAGLRACPGREPD